MVRQNGQFAYVGRESLLPFHELDTGTQRRMWEEAQPHFSEELTLFADIPVFSDVEALKEGIASGELVEVLPDDQRFGIVSAIRDRSTVQIGELEASVPYLRPAAISTLHKITGEIQETLFEDERCVARMAYLGFLSLRPAITSLTRTTIYQKQIASSGRFAVGRDTPGQEVHSTHERGLAFDVDHGAFYATDREGQEHAFNVTRDNRMFEQLSVMLPAYRLVLREVISRFHDTGEVMAYEEVRSGWGAWHVATPLE